MKLEKVKNIALELTLVSLIALPLIAFAQISAIEGVGDIVIRIVNVAKIIFWALVAFFAMWAGFLYLTAAGDEEKVKKAKQAFIYLIIAIAVVVSTYVIEAVLRNLLLTAPQTPL